MADALTSGTMSPELLKVAERAKREPEGRFHSLAHLIDVPALDARLPTHAQGCGGRCGWGDEGAVRAGTGAQAPMPARASGGEAIGTSLSGGSTSRRTRARRGRLGSRRLRTSWSRTPFVRCWKRSTSRTSCPVRTASGPERGAHDAIRALNRTRIGARRTGFWRLMLNPTSTAWIAPSLSSCSSFG